MTTEELIEEQLTVYGDVFDFLIDNRTLPENSHNGDLLVEYLQKVVADNIDRLQGDSVWREVMRESLLAYFYVLLQHFQEIDRQQEKETGLLRQFVNAGTEKKDAMWPMICDTIERLYSEEINIEGYKKQIDGENRAAVFGALASDWDMACKAKTHKHKMSMLEHSCEKWESTFRVAGKRDYAQRLQLDRLAVQYPALKDILRIMGREKEEDRQEKDCVVRKYLPSTVSMHPSVEEIDRVEQGDTIPRALPSELALIADIDTEPLFYKRYAVKELHQLSAPCRDKPLKDDNDKDSPRLAKGPVVAAIDTSASMTGKPIKIATALLLQLLRMARKEGRKCFLISFSVRAKSLDLSIPGNWNKIASFLSDSYSGGTEGEQMLCQAMDVLDEGTFEMADILIISDFCFPKPLPTTQNRMEENRKKGTRFYGLQIGDYSSAYDELLDRLWRI